MSHGKSSSGYCQGLREGGLGGTLYPGPGLGGPGRVEVVASSFEPNFSLSCPFSVPGFGQIRGPNLSEDLFLFFFCSSPNFGQKIGPNLREDLFFCSSPNFGQIRGPNLSEDLQFDLFVCTSLIFGGPASIFVPPGKISL